MGYTARFSEQWELIDHIAPASHTVEQNTGALNLANYVRTAIVIHCGVIGADLDVDIEQATTSGGALITFDAGSKDITIPNADDDTVSIIEIRNEEFSAGYEYLNVELTPGGASIFGVEVWGEPVYKPAATTNLDTVTD